MPESLPFTIADLTLRQGATEHGAVVITPKSAMTIGRARLAHLEGATGINAVERELVSQVRARERARVVLFRAMNEAGQRVWQFDPKLSESELCEAGIIMTRALLPLHRRLMAAGVMLMIHTDWGARECLAMREGIRRVRQALASSTKGPTEAADDWLLSHMLLHVGLDLTHVTRTLLPGHLMLIERRWTRVREIVARLPPEAID